MEKELEQFQADLLQSVRQMKAGKAVQTTQVKHTPSRRSPRQGRSVTESLCRAA